MKPLNLSELTLEQKIGMVICVRDVLNKEDEEFILDMIEKKSVGAIQIRFTDKYQDFMKKVKEKADYPILVCADMETGFPMGKGRYPCAMSIASCGDPKVAYELGRITGIEAKNAGANVIWGPVVDVAVEGALCKINRCFGDDVSIISEYTTQMIKGLQDEGMIATAKHFPGCHDMKNDTHLQMGFCNLTEDELLECDLVPYIHAMKNANLASIMTEHVVLNKIDDKNVATLSKKVLDIIRKQGFDGMIVSDSFAMMAIVQNYGLMECLGVAIDAGIDMVLPNYRLTFKESYDYLLKAYHEGAFTEERLNDAVRHVIEAQNKTMKEPSQKELTAEQFEFLENIRKRAISAVIQDGYTAAIPENTKKLFVLFCENAYRDPAEESKELIVDNEYSRKRMLERKERILKEFPGSDVYIMDEFPNAAQMEAACDMISKVDDVIVFPYCYFQSYLGSDGITERVETFINANAQKITAVVHSGNPYEIKKYKNIKRILVNQQGTQIDNYIFDILKGKVEPEGIIPVKL